MKWKYVESNQNPWKRVFAIFPVKIGKPCAMCDGDIIVWMQFVWRRWFDSYYGASSYEYAINPPAEEN